MKVNSMKPFNKADILIACIEPQHVLVMGHWWTVVYKMSRPTVCSEGGLVLFGLEADHPGCDLAQLNS